MTSWSTAADRRAREAGCNAARSGRVPGRQLLMDSMEPKLSDAEAELDALVNEIAGLYDPEDDGDQDLRLREILRPLLARCSSYKAQAEAALKDLGAAAPARIELINQIARDKPLLDAAREVHYLLGRVRQGSYVMLDGLFASLSRLADLEVTQ